jgi:caffeoyl-CoA O-methyltransferase
MAPALQTLSTLPNEADIDLVFIDADKPSYGDYWDALVPRVRPGGVLLADNVLWSGEIAPEPVTDDNIAALRRFNDKVAADDRAADDRVDAVVLPAFDGLTIAHKL